MLTSFRRLAFHVAMASFELSVSVIELTATELRPLCCCWFVLPSNNRW
jgi:hypothetical protein